MEGERRARTVKRRMAAGFVAALVIAFAEPASAATSNFTYTYDAYGRLASVSYTSGATTYTVTYSYDKAGNRTAATTTVNTVGSIWGSFLWGSGTW